MNPKIDIRASTAFHRYITFPSCGISAFVQFVPLNSSAPSNGRSVNRDKNPKQRGEGSTALVVDDNTVVRKILAAAFLAGGFETCGEAANGQEGIEIAKRVHPDVITLDLSMPVMNGLEAAAKLRQLFPKTPIILFTLYADSLSPKDAAKAGVDLVVLKTAPLSTLIEKAIELMDRN